MTDIRNNYIETLEKIADCADHCSRETDSIHLVVVTKGQSAEKINRVIEAGAKVLGENYPEETNEKISKISGPISWHMIGHLQSRKIKFIVDEFSMIHSIDRDEIAKKLNDSLAEANKKMPALFEVNLSGEGSKSGYPAWNENDWPKLIDHFQSLRDYQGLDFCGFMTMPPFTDDPETSRPLFQKCRNLLEMYQQSSGDMNFNKLSMGTSLDYRVAIQEGATYIRIGQAIMGERFYK